MRHRNTAGVVEVGSRCLRLRSFRDCKLPVQPVSPWSDLTCSMDTTLPHECSNRLGSREFGGQVDVSFLRRFCSVPTGVALQSGTSVTMRLCTSKWCLGAWCMSRHLRWRWSCYSPHLLLLLMLWRCTFYLSTDCLLAFRKSSKTDLVSGVRQHQKKKRTVQQLRRWCNLRQADVLCTVQTQ